jgi:hypothetical protein
VLIKKKAMCFSLNSITETMEEIQFEFLYGFISWKDVVMAITVVKFVFHGGARET